MNGLFQLRTPQDLRAKLHHDYERLRSAPSDVYAAFDFFVTAEHMLDWLYPGNSGKAERKKHRNADLILQVVSHVANGAKHMIAEDPRHVSVRSAGVILTAYGSGPYGAGAYGGKTLLIELEGPSAAEFGATITPLALAEKVLAYWHAHPALD